MEDIEPTTANINKSILKIEHVNQMVISYLIIRI